MVDTRQREFQGEEIFLQKDKILNQLKRESLQVPDSESTLTSPLSRKE